MTASERNKHPDFFEEHGTDPVTAATRYPPDAPAATKRKAGFYLTESLLERFNRHFHQMKLAGAPIENKSALLELALDFALEDLEKGERSILLRTLNKRN
jgi:hypothetical protein